MAADKAHAAVNIQKKVDRKSRSEAVANIAHAVEAGSTRGSMSTQMVGITTEEPEIRAATAAPLRQPLGLSIQGALSSQPASREDLTQEWGWNRKVGPFA